MRRPLGKAAIMMFACGGLSDQAGATAEVQLICDKMKAQAEKKAGRSFNIFIAKSYKTHAVSGTNYFIKVHVGGEQYVHLCVFKKMPCFGGDQELRGIQYPKTLQDTIVFF
ncbi:cystatin-B-like [Clarias magur]|uniref:Cystatin-B n=1 Tax=Clarias magur TaxID=1594786 RepID=A0A8J4UCI0_CLAMG|nr:cystatin-B-like [Clarias magur]